MQIQRSVKKVTSYTSIVLESAFLNILYRFQFEFFYHYAANIGGLSTVIGNFIVSITAKTIIKQ